MLLKNAEGKYDATLFETYAGRGGQGHKKEVLAQGLSCTFEEEEPGILARVDAVPVDYLRGATCTVDKRPVDGELKELTIRTGDAELFSAALRSAFYDRRSGGEVSETVKIGSGLKVAGRSLITYEGRVEADYVGKTIFVRDQLAVGGPRVEIALLKLKDGSYDARYTLSAEGRKGSNREENLLGAGLACNFAKDAAGTLQKVICYVDERPVDGVLNEIAIERQSNGLFNAKQRIALTSIISGESVDKTEDLVKNLQLH